MIRNEIVLILGKKRKGKTTLAFNMLEDRRFIFLDPKGQLAKNNLLVTPRVTKFDQKEFKAFLRGDRLYYVVNGRVEICNEALDRLAALIKKRPEVLLDFVLVVDESQFFTHSNYIRPSLADLVAHGGQHGLDIVFIVREAHEVHKFLRSQTDTIISFQQDEPSSLDWCEKIKGGCRESLPKLKFGQYEYLRMLD